MIKLSEAYKKLPDGVKQILKYGYSCVPLRVRLGNKFYRQLKFLEDSQWWSLKELENYQNAQLKKLIKHAVENVPYYRNLFRKLNLTAKDVETVEDLQKLPILTKAIIRENFEQLRAESYNNDNVVKCSTSGTTGKPLTFYYDKENDYLNFDPFIWRFFGWGGHKVGKLGAKLAAWTLREHDFYSYNPVRKLLILSAYNLNFEHVDQYAQALQQYKVEFIDTYPSSMELLTKYLKMKNIQPPTQFKAIFCHSEILHDWQRKLIEDYWGCKCFNWYGLEERVILGVECEQHNGLHLCSDFAITEFVDDKAVQGQKIIATSLTNYAMPFIRYDTGDVGYLQDEVCSCKRGFPLFELQGGREKSFAIGKDGASIPIANVDIPDATDNVIQFQFVQEQKGVLNLNIIKRDQFGDTDVQRIHAKLTEKFGKNMDVNIAFVDSIQTTNNRKTAIFVQKLKESEVYGIV